MRCTGTSQGPSAAVASERKASFLWDACIFGFRGVFVQLLSDHSMHGLQDGYVKMETCVFRVYMADDLERLFAAFKGQLYTRER